MKCSKILSYIVQVVFKEIGNKLNSVIQGIGVGWQEAEY